MVDEALDEDPSLSGDALSTVTAYRLAVELATATWPDAKALARDEFTQAVAPQLLRAAGSIGANVAEGYGRASSRDRARYYEYALGSARETAHWYRVVRPQFKGNDLTARLRLLRRIKQLLVAMISDERRACVADSQSAS